MLIVAACYYFGEKQTNISGFNPKTDNSLADRTENTAGEFVDKPETHGPKLNVCNYNYHHHSISD